MKIYRNEIGILHRDDGPAVEYTNGDKHWFVDGQSHRIDGPAIEYNDGSKSWYQNGLRHRLDGPAIEDKNGHTAWYINNEEITDKANQWLAEQNITLPMTESELTMFILTFVGK
jgi:hypothetical protein